MSKFDYTVFFEEVEAGLTMYSHNLSKIVYEAPNMHNKLLNRWTIESHKLHTLELEKNKVFAEKFHFFRYEYEINITSNEIAKYYVQKDKEYIEVLKKYNNQFLLVQTIDKWMKKADKIGFEIKNMLEALKFLDGS